MDYKLSRLVSGFLGKDGKGYIDTVPDKMKLLKNGE